MSTVLVTGAAGAVGARLLPALREAGWRIRALVHRRPVAAADERVAGDLLDEDSLRAAAAEVDAVVHLAAVTHARRAGVYDRVNREGTAALARAARAAGVRRFVHVSTRAIAREGGAYSRSKAEAEEVVRRFLPEATIVRLPEVFGAGGTEGADAILAAASTGRPVLIVGDGSQELRPVHVADVVSALVAALTSPAAPGRTYTLGGEATTVRGFAEAAVAAHGGRSRVVSIPEPLVLAASVAARIVPLPLYPDQLARLRAPKSEPDDRSGEDLGFAPRPFVDVLAGAS